MLVVFFISKRTYKFIFVKIIFPCYNGYSLFLLYFNKRPANKRVRNKLKD
jgi:hypothetical protein